MSEVHVYVSPERQAVLYQETVDSAHRNIDNLHTGHDCAASFLLECLRERVWEKTRRLSMSDAPPMSFSDFVKERYPHGLGSSFEQLEEIISVGIDPHAKGKFWPSLDLELRRLWQEISGRKLPPMTPTQDIPLKSVVVPEQRKRALNKDRVAALADSIRSLGLLNPITVAMDRTLVAGLHRLEACRTLGYKRITARVAHLDDLHRELAEIDENLVRSELTTLERAEHLARRKAIYESLHPQTKRGVAGGKASGISRSKDKSGTTEIISVVPFDQDTAKQTGQTARTIRQEVQIATSLTPEAKAAIKDTPLANKKVELLELAREKDPTKQLELADAVTSGKAKSVKEAKKQAKVSAPIEPPPEEPAQTEPEPAPAPKPKKRVRFDGEIVLHPNPEVSAERIRQRFGDDFANALREAL